MDPQKEVSMARTQTVGGQRPARRCGDSDNVAREVAGLFALTRRTATENGHTV